MEMKKDVDDFNLMHTTFCSYHLKCLSVFTLSFLLFEYFTTNKYFAICNLNHKVRILVFHELDYTFAQKRGGWGGGGGVELHYFC